MQIKTLVVGIIQTNCYIISDAGETIVVDPGDRVDRIMDALDGRPLKAIVLTHNHWDHTGGMPQLAHLTGAPVYVHKLDADEAYQEPRTITGAGRMPRHCAEWHTRALEEGKRPDVLLKDGDRITVGDCAFDVLNTPGHTAGSICLYCAQEKVLLAGDTLFSGGRFGRTDFKTGSARDMINTLQTKFIHIPDDVTVLSGHEGSSTMGVERRLNPNLK